MNNNKLEVKDFISIGLFSAIYLVLYLALIITLGMVPVIYFFIAAISNLIMGTIYTLFISKVGKKYSVAIMGSLIVLIVSFMTGVVWTKLVFGLGAVALAEFFVSRGEYKSFKLNTISFVCFGFLLFGTYASFWILKDEFMQMLIEHSGTEYADIIATFINPTMLIVIIVVTIIGAIAGSFIGKGLLKKHFERAGIV